MKINVSTLTIDTSLSNGFLNVYKRTTDGRLVTGKKTYASTVEAARRSRPADNWTRVGVVDASEYVREIKSLESMFAAMSAAKSSLIRTAETWLSGKLSIAATLPEAPRHTSEAEVGGYNPLKAPSVKAKIKSLKATIKRKATSKPAKAKKSAKGARVASTAKGR